MIRAWHAQVDTSDRGRDLYEHMLACEPCSVKDRASFVERMGTLYDFIAVVPDTQAATPDTQAATPDTQAEPHARMDA